jgi:hemerythrin
MDIEPQDELEVIELGVLSQELLYRVRELCIRVELQQRESPELATSTLVIELLEILRACEPSPDRIDTEGGNAIELLPWSDLYCVGVKGIDDQHRILVNLLNRLGQVASRLEEKKAVDETLMALVDYVRGHFAYEEGLMLEHGFASMKSHAEAHGRLTERLRKMIARQDENSTLTIEELMAFLRQWLISHILHTDRALGTALNVKGIH